MHRGRQWGKVGLDTAGIEEFQRGARGTTGMRGGHSR